MCRELTVEEWEADFDNVFEAVENGETFLIRTENGRACYLMPYAKYEEDVSSLTVGG